MRYTHWLCNVMRVRPSVRPSLDGGIVRKNFKFPIMTSMLTLSTADLYRILPKLTSALVAGKDVLQC